MAKTIATIQSLVRWECRDQTFSLVDTSGLQIGNSLYRRLCALIEWPELNREDSTLSTTSGTEKYTWPATNTYIDITGIEIQDPYDNSKYKQVSAAPSELEFNLMREKPKAFPELYKRGHDGTNNVLRLAPKPDTTGLTIRLTGQIEPAEYTGSTDTTVFIMSSADDALSYIIAADVLDKREQPQRANRLVGRAAELLSRIAGKEITPDELKSRVLAQG